MIILSKHITDEMDGRRIRPAYIAAALTAPDRTTPDPTDPALTRAYKTVPEFGGRIPRVVYRRSGDDTFVVTAHWDRGARR